MNKRIAKVAISQGSTRPLQFGVVCEGSNFEAWQVDCIKGLLALDSARLSVVIAVDVAPRDAAAKHRLVSDHFSWKVFQRVVHPFARRPVSPSPFSRTPILACRLQADGEGALSFDEADLEAIQHNDLDFIVCFSPPTVGRQLCDLARYGVWSFHHADIERYGGRPPCFWEIYDGNPITGAALVRLTRDPNSVVVLKKGHFKSIGYSYARAVDSILFETACWPAYVVSAMQNNAAYQVGVATCLEASTRDMPGVGALLRFLMVTLRNAVSHIFQRYFKLESWNLGVIDCPISDFLSNSHRPPVKWCGHVSDSIFLADPFGFEVDGLRYVLHEEFDYAAWRGSISSFSFDGNTWQEVSRDALGASGHSSYPFIIRSGDEIYCMPESYEAREVALYKFVTPTKWERVATLISDLAAIDSSVFQHDGLWWLTCTDQEAGSNDKLLLWYASDLFGPWRPHAANPVKLDVRSSRPAGTPFVHNGRLYRPAQDCSRVYGGRIVINEITRLTTEEFEEQPVSYVEPTEPFAAGVHTISALGNMTIVDGKRYILSLRRATWVLGRALAKLKMMVVRSNEHGVAGNPYTTGNPREDHAT